ncbi:MAG: metal-dependent hydrolase [Deltaproteobacteria bacterium]|jgi:L-ascorbate metabolism protein UlaG (beta-lactamase superfamily)|nr:metal-dependent hydrolase [Deltaproteobacteria bacterium]
MSVKVTWLGHAAFLIETGKYNLVIDPFLTDNPQASCKADELPELSAILVTHGHRDHLGDTLHLAKKFNCLVVSTVEIANYLKGRGVKHVHGQQPGGAWKHPFGKVKLTRAFHGSFLPDGSYGGQPVGFLLEVEGVTIYHAGDTALFSDMKLIGRKGVDLALLPCGDNFTMGTEDAALAATYIHPRIAVPMHYGTWELIDTDPQDFARRLQGSSIKPVILKPGESLSQLIR